MVESADSDDEKMHFDDEDDEISVQNETSQSNNDDDNDNDNNTDNTQTNQENQPTQSQSQKPSTHHNNRSVIKKYNIEEIFPPVDEKYYQSSDSKTQTEVGFDSMVSLHWVSVKSLFQQGIIPPHTPYARFLASQQIPKKYNVHSANANPDIVSDYQQYSQLLNTFQSRSQKNELVVTTTGFTFPISWVMATICHSNDFSIAMSNLLQQRAAMLYPSFQP
jgi:hypothetical protein